MLNHCLIHGVKISGRKPKHSDFMPQKRKSTKGQANLVKAMAQIAAIQAQKTKK